MKRINSPASMGNFSISNLNETNPEDESAVSNHFSTALGAFILSLVFLLGVPGNLFIVWSILAHIRRRSVTTLLILNLAFADGLLMVLTIFFIVYLAMRTWVFGNVMCKGVFYLCNSNMYASIFLITLMSVYRMVVLVLPKKTSSVVTRKFMKRTIIGMWVLVMAISTPSAVFREVRFQYTFETVLGFIIPYAIIITSYVLIVKRLRQTKFQRKVHSEKLILAIVVTFGIFWLPYHIINMLQVAAEWYPDDSPTKETLEMIANKCRVVTSAFAFTSSCANPVLYTFAGKSYIKQSGFSFMARLFEGTSLEQTVNKSRFTRKDNLGNSVHSSNSSAVPISHNGVQQ